MVSKVACLDWMLEYRSLILIKQIREPNTNPWGTPDFTGSGVDADWSITMDCLFWNYSIHLTGVV